MSLVKSFFVPDSNLQGSEIPIHVIWEKEIESITIYYPYDLLEIKEIYNVKKEGLETLDGILNLSSFEVNGYAGLLFSTKKVETPSAKGEIKLAVVPRKGEKEVLSKDFFLFRPQLIVLKKPSRILITKSGRSVKIHNKIQIANKGEGTAMAFLNFDDESQLKSKKPENIDKFLKNFSKKFLGSLQKLKSEFQTYSKELDKFIDYTKSPFKFDDESLNQFKEINNNLNQFFEIDEDFLKAFLEAIFGAFISSIHSITDLHILLEYLKSITLERIILFDAMSMLEIENGINKLTAELMITDLAANIYEPIPLNVEIETKTSEKIRIPLYSIFQWGLEL